MGQSFPLTNIFQDGHTLLSTNKLNICILFKVIQTYCY